MFSKCIHNSFLDFLLRFGFYLFAFPEIQRPNLFCVCFSRVTVYALYTHFVGTNCRILTLSVFTQSQKKIILYLIMSLINLFNISLKQIPSREYKSLFPKISLPQFYGATSFSVMFSPKTAK